MPWKVPITVDGLTYPVEFGGDSEPSETDINAAVQQILAQSEQPPKEAPGYLSQLGTALSIGGRQMTAGLKGTFNALTGDDADTAEAMARMGALQREQEQAQTPQDIALTREFAKSKAAYDKAQGVWDTAEALSGYFGDVAEYPGAAFKQAVQSAPNAAIGTGTSIAGYALGGLLGVGAGVETGPGAILTGIAGAAAGGAVSNSLMEAGPAIYDVLNERTNGAAANMTAEQIAEVLRKDPTITAEGLKTGAIRGTVIGLVESLGMKGAGSILTIPERAAARAAQKTLIDAGVDVASKEAIEAAMKNVALRKSVSDAASTAKSQFTSAGNLARGAAATTIETASAGAGEVAAQAATGQEIDPTAAVQEMIGEVGINAALTPAVKAAELAKRKPVTPAPDTDFARRAAMEGATEFRDTTTGVPVVVEGVTIATIPPGSDLSPDDVAAFAAEPDMLKTLARSGQITLPEIVKPVEGVDETLTDEMNQNIAAGAIDAPATVEELKKQEAQRLAEEEQTALPIEDVAGVIHDLRSAETGTALGLDELEMALDNVEGRLQKGKPIDWPTDRIWLPNISTASAPALIKLLGSGEGIAAMRRRIEELRQQEAERAANPALNIADELTATAATNQDASQAAALGLPAGTLQKSQTQTDETTRPGPEESLRQANPPRGGDPAAEDVTGTGSPAATAAPATTEESVKLELTPEEGGATGAGMKEEIQQTSDLPQNKSRQYRGGTASWVIRNKETGEVIKETFEPEEVRRINTSKYEAVPIGDYLESLNAPPERPTPGMSREEFNRGMAAKVKQATAEQGVLPPITPTGEAPTDSLPADQPTSGDVGAGAAVQRDPSKPEQMTPEEYRAADRERFGPKGQEDVLYEGNTDEGVGKAMAWHERNRAMQKAGFDSGQAIRDLDAGVHPTHAAVIRGGVKSNLPVSAEAVDTYGIELPEGYVRQGELYVFQPQPKPADVGTGAAPVERPKRPRVAPKTVEEALAREAESAAAQEFLGDIRAERDQAKRQERRNAFIQQNATGPTESVFLRDMILGGWDKALGDVDGGRITAARADALAQAALDAGLIDQTTRNRFQPTVTTATETQKLDFFSAALQEARGEAVEALREAMNSGRGRFKGRNITLLVTPSSRDDVMLQVTRVSNEGEPQGHQDIIDEQDFNDELKDQDNLDVVLEHIRPDIGQARTLGAFGIPKFRKPVSFNYRLRLREVGPGTAPAGFISSEGRDVSYDRPLTRQEMFDFEMSPVGATPLTAQPTVTTATETPSNRAKVAGGSQGVQTEPAEGSIPAVTTATVPPAATESTGEVQPASSLSEGDSFRIGDNYYTLKSKLKDGRIRAVPVSGPAFDQWSKTPELQSAGVVIAKNRKVVKVAPPPPAPVKPAPADTKPEVGSSRFPAEYVSKVRPVAVSRISQDSSVKENYESVLGVRLTDGQAADLAVEIMQQGKARGDMILIGDALSTSLPDWAIEEAWEAVKSTTAPRNPAENLVSFTAANGQKLVGEVQSVTGNKATVAYSWNGKTKTQVVPVSQLGSPVASVATPPKYLYNQEQNTRKLGKHFPTSIGVHANHDFRKSFASMAEDTSLSQTYRMVAKVLAKMPEFEGIDLHLVADENIKYAGEYSWNDGKTSIAVNLRHLGRGKVDALGSILHEALHHVTLAKVRNPQGAYENEVVGKLDAIREKVIEYAESKGLAKALDYELGSLEEFITAIFTRPDFQAFLASIPESEAAAAAVGKFRSILSEIFRRIAELVTGKPVLRGSALEQAMTTSLALFNTPFRGTETGGLEALNAARSYAGERAQMPQFMRDSLETAQAMAAAGKTSEEIRAVTGWFPGKYDGKMRWEIPDEGATLRLDEFRKSRTAGNSPEEVVRKFFSEKQARQQDEALAFAKGMPKEQLLEFSRDFTARKKAENAALYEFFVKGDNKDNGRVPLGYILDHPALFEAYPELQWVPVSFSASDASEDATEAGSFNPSTGVLFLSPLGFSQKGETLSTTLHEIQHWIQGREGFAKGGNAEALAKMYDFLGQAVNRTKLAKVLRDAADLQDRVGAFTNESVSGLTQGEMDIAFGAYDTKLERWMSSEELRSDAKKLDDAVLNTDVTGYEAYRRLAGEIEARDVQARQRFTPEQRKAVAPYSSENIAKEDAIVMFGGDGAQASMGKGLKALFPQTGDKAAKPSALAEQWWAATTRQEARAILEPASLEELKAIAVRMDENPNQSKAKLIDRLVQITGAYADAVGIRGADAIGPRGPMPDYTGQKMAAQQRMREQKAARAQQPKERGLPAKAKPRTPEEFARDMAALMARPVSETKPVNLSAAYQKATVGKSSQWVTIKEVYEQAKADNPSLTPEAFMAQIEQQNEAGGVMISPVENVSTVEAARPFVVGNAGVEMLVPGGTAASRIDEETDAEYLAAVEAGDMEKAQAMVDAAAGAYSRIDEGEPPIDIGGVAEPADGGGTQLFQKDPTAIGSTYTIPADITLQERRSQEETLAKARKIIAEEVQKDEKGGRAVALQRFKIDTSLPPEVRAVGTGLIAQQADLLANLEREAVAQQGLDRLAEEAGKVSGIISSDFDHWRNLQLAANLDIDKMAEEAGRTLNIFNVFRRLTPEGFLRRMKRQYNDTVRESMMQNFDIPPGEVEAEIMRLWRMMREAGATARGEAIAAALKAFMPRRVNARKIIESLFPQAGTRQRMSKGGEALVRNFFQMMAGPRDQKGPLAEFDESIQNALSGMLRKVMEAKGLVAKNQSNQATDIDKLVRSVSADELRFDKIAAADEAMQQELDAIEDPERRATLRQAWEEATAKMYTNIASDATVRRAINAELKGMNVDWRKMFDSNQKPDAIKAKVVDAVMTKIEGLLTNAADPTVRQNLNMLRDEVEAAFDFIAANKRTEWLAYREGIEARRRVAEHRAAFMEALRNQGVAEDALLRISKKLLAGPLPQKPDQNPVSALVGEHMKGEVPNFVDKLVALDVDRATAEQLDTAAKALRADIAEVEKLKAAERAVKKLMDSLKPKPRAPREKIEKALKALFTAAETGALDSQEFFDALGEALGHPPLTAEQQAKIKKLTREINALPKGAARVDKQQELDEELALWKGIAARDVLLSAWYANILSGISTQGIGLFGNLVNFIPRSLFLAATNPRSANAYFQGAFGEGLKTGLREAAAALKGRGLYKVSKYGDKNMVSALELLRKKGPATLPEWIAYIASGGTRLRYVFRIMQAIDALAWNTAREGQAYLAAHRALLDQQRADGVKRTPEEFYRALIDNLGGDAKRIEEDMRAAREDLIARGQTPDLLTVDRMAREARNARRSSTATKLSNRFADRIVMQQDPEGIGDVISSIITVIQKKGNFMGVPFGQLLIPFNKIVANLFEQSLDYTPVGALRSYFGGHLTDIQSINWSGKAQFKDKAVQFDAVERAERMAASVTGTLAASVMFALASLFKDEPDEDVPFMLYGFGPESKSKRDQMPKGWTPYSAKIGDTYIKFSEMPFGVMFAAAGNALDAMRYKNMDKKSSAERLAYVLKTSAKGFTEQGVLSSFDTALEVLTFQASDKKFTDVPVNVAKGMVPAQGMLRDLSVLFDPVKIKDDTISAALLRDFPVVRRIGTRPALNVFGEPVTFDGRIPFVRRIATVREEHAAADYLGRNKLSVPGMAQTIVVGQYLPKDMRDRIQRRALETSAMENGVFTVEQDYNFRKRAGELTKVAVENLMKQVPTITSDKQRENVQNLINRKVEIARRRAMLEAVPAQ